MQYMLAESEEQIANEWNKYSGYTVRPVQSTVEYYSKLIAKYSQNNNFMMYGGTPEIRTIFQRQNKPVTMVDRSEKIIRSMGLLTDQAIPLASNERFIQSDWLDLSYISDLFDVVIGDDAINMVNWNHFDLFLKNACKVICYGGIFICHLLVKPEDTFINSSLSELADEFNSGIIKSKYDLASRLNFSRYDSDSYAMGWQKTIKEIGFDKLANFKPEFDYVETFGLCNSQFYCPPQQHFEKLVEKYFSIEEIFYPHEHQYCMFEPVYVLKKKL